MAQTLCSHSLSIPASLVGTYPTQVYVRKFTNVNGLLAFKWMPHRNKDALAHLRKQVQELITASYPTIEQFCWDKDLNKATVSNFLHDKKDFQLSTLIKLANALNKKLTVRLD